MNNPVPQPKISEGIKYNLSVVLCVLLIFAGVYFSLPFNGVAALLPVFTLCCLFAATLPSGIWLKVLITFTIGALLDFIYYNDNTKNIMYTVIFVLIMFICHFSVSLFKNKKPAGLLAGSVLVVLCVFLQFGFFGNPFNASKAYDSLIDFKEKHYADGNVAASKIEYDFRTGMYSVGISDITDPTVVKNLEYKNGYIDDQYIRYAEKTVAEDYLRNTVTPVLRNAFPEDYLDIEIVDIAGFSRFTDKNIRLPEKEFVSRLNILINIPTGLTFEESKAVALRYHYVLLKEKLVFNSVTFTMCGNVLSARLLCFPYTDLDRLLKPNRQYTDFYNALKN